MILETRDSDRAVKPPSLHAKANISCRTSAGQRSMVSNGGQVNNENRFNVRSHSRSCHRRHHGFGARSIDIRFGGSNLAHTRPNSLKTNCAKVGPETGPYQAFRSSWSHGEEKLYSI
jgi:hypothetical protein